MKAIITINMDNAAFGDPSELGWILRQLGDKIACYPQSTNIQDTNGNTVGNLKIVK